MKPVLHIISDRNRHRLPLLQALVESAKGGADVIQIRDKKSPACETYSLVRQLQNHLQERNLVSQIFVNDRADIAITTDISGVHLASKSLPIASVVRLRKLADWSGQIGCSVHELDEAILAEEAGADYVTFGHIFASESHPGVPPRGVYALRRVVDALSIPVIAIGGIDHTNVETVLETGCSGIAVIGAVLNTTDPLNAVKKLKGAMEKSEFLPKVAFLQKTRQGDHENGCMRKG
ncbi:thiamine phosphate synthase [Alicyclobacillus dauci]|uniref:Thiamine-phosphate synthase n=1 Tax=Alicyclobacillus dauci TaxID=1475485 RepID=A0ABY6Z4M9_9BACL|nr:thiamine phosphate synthase [Alicyclobacillus dauci]WAH36965.1 thiamine phosphate synthase [Alicyclobacillus dauci]